MHGNSISIIMLIIQCAMKHSYFTINLMALIKKLFSKPYCIDEWRQMHKQWSQQYSVLCYKIIFIIRFTESLTHTSFYLWVPQLSNNNPEKAGASRGLPSLLSVYFTGLRIQRTHRDEPRPSPQAPPTPLKTQCCTRQGHLALKYS